MFVGLLLAEAALRIVGYGRQSPVRYVFDPDCGARLIANYSAHQNEEGLSWLTTNSHGFRDRERTLEKSGNVFRIAILGDSFCEAAQVNMHETFWSVLEAELNSRQCLAGQTIEVLNFGVSGYGTAQELHMFRKFVRAYSPDLVLLCFLPGNDVANNSSEIEQQKTRPFYSLKGDRLVLDSSFLKSAPQEEFRSSAWLQFKDGLVSNSRVARLIYDARHPAVEQESKPLECGIHEAAFFEPKNDIWRRAWAITDSLILTLHKDVLRADSRFALVVLNNGMQVSPDPEQANLDWPDNHLRKLANSNSFHCISLTPMMQQIAQDRKVFFHGFPNTEMGKGHWNGNGHRIAGKLIANEICPTLEQPSGKQIQ